MPILHFKNFYKIKTDLETIIINPIERMENGLKTTTFRMKPKKFGIHKIAQGNYFKPFIPDFQINIYKIEKRTINSLSEEEIIYDLGLNEIEIDSIVSSSLPLQVLFLKGIQEINKHHHNNITSETIGYLHYFKIIKNNKEV